MSDEIQKADPGVIGTTRDGFGETSVERTGERLSTMLAAQAQAKIQARCIMAMQRPRDLDTVRVKLLKECSRPGFARSAYYSIERFGAKPGRLTGTKNRIEGLTVRFAESAIRLMGNLDQTTEVISDDEFMRSVRVGVIDLEVNSGYSYDLTIAKTIERRKIKDHLVLATRTNSAGETVYIVAATEDELLQKEGALVSKRFRTMSLRLVPSDIIEECERKVVRVALDEDAKDPAAARKQIADSFASLNVMPSDLKDYLGHELDRCSPAELTALRGLFAAVREGETTWDEIMAQKSNASAAAANGQAAADKPKTQTERVADRVGRRGGAKAAAAAEQTAADATPKPDATPATTPTTTAEAKPEPKPEAKPEPTSQARKPDDPPFGSADQEAKPAARVIETTSGTTTIDPSYIQAEFEDRANRIWAGISTAKSAADIDAYADEIRAFEDDGGPNVRVNALRNHLESKKAKVVP
jgi:hypothetical protein